MKEGTTYPTNTAIGVLLIGEPGSGKTNFAMDWPTPYFLDADGNLKNAVDRHPGKKFFFDNPAYDDSGNLLPMNLRWPRCVTLMDAALKNPAVKTVVADSLTRLCSYLQAHLVEQKNVENPVTMCGVKCMSKSHWQPFATIMRKFIFDAREYGKPFIMTCHIKIGIDEITSVKEQGVNISGQLQGEIAGMFTDFLLAIAEPSTDKIKYPTGVRYYLQTGPTSRIAAKNSLGLPLQVDVDGPEIKAMLARLSAPVAPVTT